MRRSSSLGGTGSQRPSLSSMRHTGGTVAGGGGGGYDSYHDDTDYDDDYDYDDIMMMDRRAEREEERRLSEKFGEAVEGGGGGGAGGSSSPGTNNNNNKKHGGGGGEDEDDIAREYAKQQQQKKRKQMNGPRSVRPEDLVSSRGLIVVRRTFPSKFHHNDTHPKGRSVVAAAAAAKKKPKFSKTPSSMARYSRQLMSHYADWMDGLMPGMSLSEGTWRIYGSLSSKQNVKAYLQTMREEVRNEHIEFLMGLESAERLIGQFQQYDNSASSPAGGAAYGADGEDEEEAANYDDYGGGGGASANTNNTNHPDGTTTAAEDGMAATIGGQGEDEEEENEEDARVSGNANINVRSPPMIRINNPYGRGGGTETSSATTTADQNAAGVQHTQSPSTATTITHGGAGAVTPVVGGSGNGSAIVADEPAIAITDGTSNFALVPSRTGDNNANNNNNNNVSNKGKLTKHVLEDSDDDEDEAMFDDVVTAANSKNTQEDEKAAATVAATAAVNNTDDDDEDKDDDVLVESRRFTVFEDGDDGKDKEDEDEEGDSGDGIHHQGMADTTLEATTRVSETRTNTLEEASIIFETQPQQVREAGDEEKK